MTDEMNRMPLNMMIWSAFQIFLDDNALHKEKKAWQLQFSTVLDGPRARMPRLQRGEISICQPFPSRFSQAEHVQSWIHRAAEAVSLNWWDFALYANADTASFVMQEHKSPWYVGNLTYVKPSTLWEEHWSRFMPTAHPPYSCAWPRF